MHPELPVNDRENCDVLCYLTQAFFLVVVLGVKMDSGIWFVVGLCMCARVLQARWVGESKSSKRKRANGVGERMATCFTAARLKTGAPALDSSWFNINIGNNRSILAGRPP